MNKKLIRLKKMKIFSNKNLKKEQVVFLQEKYQLKNCLEAQC